MSFIPKAPLSMPEISTSPSSPIEGTRGIFAKSDGLYEIDSNGNEVRIATNSDLTFITEKISQNPPKIGDNNNWYTYDFSTDEYVDSGIPANTYLENKENVANKTSEISSGSTDEQYPSAKAVYEYIQASVLNVIDETWGEAI